MRENGFNPLSREDYLSFKKWLMYTNIDSFPTGQRSTGLSESNSDWELLHKMEIWWNRLALFRQICSIAHCIHLIAEGRSRTDRQ